MAQSNGSKNRICTILDNLPQGTMEVHLLQDKCPRCRVSGMMVGLTQVEPLDRVEIHDFLEKFGVARKSGDCTSNWVYKHSRPDGGFSFFEVMDFMSGGSEGIMIKIATPTVTKMADLILSPFIKNSFKRRGLILVTGSSGSGRSTTLAAIIDFLQGSRSQVFTMIEKPCHYIGHSESNSVIQFEVGSSDVTSFSQGILLASQLHSDVIAVDGLCDGDAAQAVLDAARGGSLVIATMFGCSTTDAINHFLRMFPHYQREQARRELSEALNGVTYQCLLQGSIDQQGVVPAFEMLVGTSEVRALIAQGKIQELYGVMQVSQKYGMRTLNMSLYDLVMAKTIPMERALGVANLPEGLERMIGQARAAQS